MTAVLRRSGTSADPTPKERRSLARIVQIEAGGWGIMKALNDAFINPLLISSGAGPLALGIYNSGANAFGFGAGWFGPRIAAKTNTVKKTTLICLILGRLIFLTMGGYLIFADKASVTILIALVLAWGGCEGLVLPLWSSFIASMVGPGQRGRWLAMRATAATLSTVPFMVALVVIFLVATREQALPVAYGLAAIAGMVSLFMVARLFSMVGEGPIPPARSFKSLPDEPGARRFLGGVLTFWFGAGFVWPVLPAYMINHLGTPTAYFAVSQLIAAIFGVFVQRRWGKLADDKGARTVLFLTGIGASIVPALWGLVPVWWLGFAVELCAYVCWPGHMLGLTLRSVELARHEQDRSSLLGWTNLAQGAGACVSPLLASALVVHTGAVPLLFLSAGLRSLGVLIMAAPSRTKPAELPPFEVVTG